MSAPTSEELAERSTRLLAQVNELAVALEPLLVEACQLERDVDARCKADGILHLDFVTEQLPQLGVTDWMPARHALVRMMNDLSSALGC